MIQSLVCERIRDYVARNEMPNSSQHRQPEDQFYFVWFDCKRLNHRAIEQRRLVDAKVHIFTFAAHQHESQRDQGICCVWVGERERGRAIAWIRWTSTLSFWIFRHLVCAAAIAKYILWNQPTLIVEAPNRRQIPPNSNGWFSRRFRWG